MARIAASGKNIVSSSVVPLVFPEHVDPQMRRPLEDACAAAGVSCFTSGIDPGWANDLLPLVLTGTGEYVTHLRVMEIVNYATYAQPTVLFDTMGFGQPLDATPLLLIPGVLSFAWGGTVKALAAGLGVELDELREVHERLPAPAKIDLGFGVVEEGTTAAMRFEVQGIVDGEPRIVLEHVTRLDDDLAPEWPQPAGHSGYRVDRHRQPELHVRRADDGRRRRPQHRRPRRHRRPPRQRDPRGLRGRPRPAVGARPAAGHRQGSDALPLDGGRARYRWWTPQ